MPTRIPDGAARPTEAVASSTSVPSRAEPSRRSAPLPARLPQQTFAEAKAACLAIAAGPLLRGWGANDGEVALRHAVDGATLEVKLAGSSLLEALGLPRTVESLREELHDLGLPAVLLLHVVLGAVLD